MGDDMGEIKVQIFYSQDSNGPGKVVKNLMEGMRLIDIPCFANRDPIPDAKKICLSDHGILRSGYINELFIGPNICTLPIDSHIVMSQQYIKYLVNSQWTYDAYKKWLPENKLAIWPVGIDTNLFSDKSKDPKEFDCLVYFKRRDVNDLVYIESILKANNQSYNTISYGNYKESEFLNLISKSRYGIIIDNCESQGIAIEEMMSCNIPLFVWDVSMWADRGPELACPSTSIPFWDDRCGASETQKNNIQNSFESFIKNIDFYHPRDYILENLTLEIQAKKLIDIIS